MGFLDGLGRMMQGKPLFEMPDQANTQDQAGEQPLQTPRNGQKIVPLVQIERLELHNNGPRMQVVLAIKNSSGGVIMLDKIRLLGIMKELDHELKAGESREFTVYDGPRPNHRNYHDADVQFRNSEGDYFLARHMVEFRQESDNTYSVYRFRFVGPIKDI